MIKIKLKKFDTVIYTEEHTQEVKYVYSIDDSTGLLEMMLTIPENSDPVEQFVIHLKDLYRYNVPVVYTVYHNNYKYTLDVDKCKYCNEWYLSRIKMW